MIELDIQNTQNRASWKMNHESVTELKIMQNDSVQNIELSSDSNLYNEFEPQHPSWFEFMRSWSVILHNMKRNEEDFRSNINLDHFHDHNLHSGNIQIVGSLYFRWIYGSLQIVTIQTRTTNDTWSLETNYLQTIRLSESIFRLMATNNSFAEKEAAARSF